MRGRQVKHVPLTTSEQSTCPQCPLYLNMLSLSYSMTNETTDDCGQAPYETGCLVEYFQA